MNLTAVVRLIGINENTLRAWERRYGAVTPSRDAQGRRFYSDKEVEKIKLLWALVNEGHSIGLIANLSHAKLKSMLSKSLSPQVVELRSGTSNAEKFLTSIISSLEKFNLESLHNSLQRARFEMSIKEIVIDLIKPLMDQVGKMNETEELSIAQEHLLSSLLRDYLGNIHQSLSPYDFASRKNAKSVFITTREGDLHEFNILMASILSNVYQFQTYYLGPNMPVEDLGKSCLRFKPDFLVLGFTHLPTSREIISPQDYLNQLDQMLPRQITFCCGGASEAELSSLSKDRQIIRMKGLFDLDKFFASESIL
jgi:DNA-binding transcriptional MerR regulator